MVFDKVISEVDRELVLRSLKKNKLVVLISIEQMIHFYGNILQLRTLDSNKIIAMSLSEFE
ncbi:arginine deiminase-related protein [Candidatus Photodesmus anomalopis]|uniref:arginine deiminase-related protein n=1 Tax=Candidatus Photodesmus anomalopis TaxID=28176 RepID=UPI003B969B84